MADVLRHRVADDRAAQALAAAEVAAAALARQEWARTPGSEPGTLLDLWFDALGIVDTTPVVAPPQ